MSSILIVADTEGNTVKEASLELVALAHGLSESTGWKPLGIVLGDDPGAAAEDLAKRGGIDVIALSDPLLADYTADAWTTALSAQVSEHDAQLILTTHGPTGWDWAARVALRCDGAPGSECVGIEKGDDGQLVFTRKVFNAKLDMKFKLSASPAVVTMQRGATAAWDKGGDGTVTQSSAGLAAEDIRGTFGGVSKYDGESKVDLSQADIIVSGGRSVGGAEKFDIIRELADALGGQVGASRPVTDAGWLPPEHQVGSSGVTVKPKLYVACGISGAIQHVVGMKGSDFIVALNKDARAPIFDVADVGVVGDLFELVPALTEAVREARG